MSGYSLQQYTPDLGEQVCDLQRLIWGSSRELNVAYLNWKYLCNPYMPVPLIYLALTGGRVVGMRAMFGTCWEAGDYTDKFILPCAADTLIEPKHRDRGLFQELTGYAMSDLQGRGYRHVLNFSPSYQNYVVSVLTMGWRHMGSSELLTRNIPLNSAAAKMIESGSRYRIVRKVRGVSRRLGIKVRTVVRPDIFARLDRNADTQGHPVNLSRESRPGPMAELIQQLGGDGRIRHVRDRTYFSWRFGNPRGSYRFLYWGEDELRGYMVLQNTIGQGHVNIVDWEATSPGPRSDLLKAALAWGRFRKVSTWGTSLPEADIEMLHKEGFAAAGNTKDSSMRDGQFMLKSLDSHDAEGLCNGRRLHEPAHWDLRMIYSDSE